MRRNDRQRRETGVSYPAGSNRREFVGNQLLPQDDMRLARGGSDFDDFVRHFVLEPQTYPGPVHQRFTDRGVMHAPRDVPLGGNALARPRTKLLEVAPRNIAAESRSCERLCSTARHSSLFTFTRCRFVGVTHKPYRLPRLGIK